MRLIFFNLLIAGFLIISGISACTDNKTTSNVTTPLQNIQQHERRNLGLDKSPMDMIYYPVDFPISKMKGESIKLPLARVIYSRPRKDGRKIFEQIVKYGSPWRLGANESTEIEFFRDVKIQNSRVSKGRYILYAVPFKEHWTLKLNTNLYSWGLNIDSSYDKYAFDVPVYSAPKSLEVFSMEFTPTNDSTQLIMGWDSVRVRLPIYIIRN